MKILHLIYDHINNPWVGGGGAVRAFEIYRRLSERHNITLVCGRYPGASDYREGNVAVKFVGTSRKNYILSTFCYAVQASDLIRTQAGRFDVVIEDFAPYNPLFSFLWRKNSIIQVHQKEGVRHIKKYAIVGALFFFIETVYPRLYGNYIAISEMSRNKFRLRGKGAVVANGFDSRLLGEESKEGAYTLYLGRLHVNQKGLDLLQDALKHTPCKLQLAGSGKDEPKVRRIFREFEESGLVEVTGFVSGERKRDLLRGCNFLLMPSRYEGQPLALIEAAACGKPAIVSDIPELKNAVDAGFALSFKTGDAKDLAKKMEILLGNERMRREMGKKAREYATQFTWDNMAVEYEKFLVSVLEGSASTQKVVES